MKSFHKPFDNESFTQYVSRQASQHLFVVYLFLLCLFNSPSPLLGQNINWDGEGADNNWNTAANWEGDVLPTADNIVKINEDTDDVIIPEGYNAVANRVLISGGASLTVEVNAVLTIADSTGERLNLSPLGANTSNTLNNHGTININNTGSGGMTVGQGDNVLNNTGTINVDNVGTSSVPFGRGMNIGGEINNSGSINLGPTLTDDGIEMQKTSTINNLPESNLNILGVGAGKDGIGRHSVDQVINNEGILCINDVTAAGGDNIQTDIVLNNTGTFSTTGCTATTGDSGSTNTFLDFDGIDDYVKSSTNVGISGASHRTVEFWVNAEPTNLFAKHIINWGGTTGATSFGFYQSFDSKLVFYGFGTGQFDYDTGFSFDGKWHHIAATYDGTMVRTYVDGVETTTSKQTLALNTADGPLYLGIREDLHVPSYSKLKMDEVRVWNMVRSPSQIQSYMNQELDGCEDGLVLYYNFNEGTCEGDNSGTTSLTDLSPSGNDGEFHNFALTGSFSNLTCSTAELTYPNLSVSVPCPCFADIIGDLTYCDGEQTTLDAGIGWVNYVWSTGAMTQTIEVTAGIYTVTVTESTGCTATESVEVIAPTPFNFDIEDATQSQTATGLNIYAVELCGGTLPFDIDLEATGGFASSTLSSSANAGCQNLQITYANGVEWAATITDANDCSDQNSIISSDDLEGTPLLVIDGFDAVKETGSNKLDGELTVNVSGGDNSCNDYTYDWSGPGINVSNTDGSTGNTLTGLASGTYNVTITDCDGSTIVGSQYIGRSGGRSRGRGGNKSAFDDLSDFGVLQLYPNPAKDFVRINYNTQQIDEITISISDLAGRILWTQVVNQEENHLDVPLGDFNNGLYIVTMSIENELVRKEKLLVVK